MAAAQHEDPELLQVQSSSSSHTPEPIPFIMSDTKILCDTSTGIPHPKFCCTVLDFLHSLSLSYPSHSTPHHC